jgi:trk system potassium uptake protein TrkA
MVTEVAVQHVIVVGCGRVGSALARRVTAAGHTASVIDRRQEAFDRFLADWPGDKILGTGFDRDRLCAAGIERATAVAAVTSGDNSNIIVARVARETYGIERVVARIYDSRRAALYSQLGIPTIATVDWSVHEAAHLVIAESDAGTEWAHPSGAVAVARRRLPEHLVGTPIAKIENSPQLRVLAVSRAGATVVLDAEALLQDNDELVLAGTRPAIADFDAKEAN